MKIPFKPITIEDKELIISFVHPHKYRNCDYSFSNICSWRFLYNTEFAIVDDFLLIRFWIENKSRVAYMTPAGKGDLRHALYLLESDSQEQGYPLCLLGVTPEIKELLEATLPGGFFYIPDRNHYDYIYLRESLVSLKGKKLQPKRNHINKFKKRYVYEYVSITPELIPQCLQVEERWFQTNQAESGSGSLDYERMAITYALNHYEQLGLVGGALLIDGQVIAFTFGASINHDTFCIHVEKADINYEGAYNVINQEFASRLPEIFTYINREEDLGIPGLRQAKLSYNPVLLLEKSAAIMKTNNKKPDEQAANN